MELYIKLLNGKPVEHPICRENMETAYPHVDLENLPVDWARFERVPRPSLGVYDVAECFYEWEGDIVKDVWYTHKMGEEEKRQKQERVKKNYIADGGYSNWIFDEETCSHIPPVPYPDDNKPYIWVQEALTWVEMKIEPVVLDLPPYPDDGKIYLFDESAKQWVEKD
jgi:hypothetical protein